MRARWLKTFGALEICFALIWRSEHVLGLREGRCMKPCLFLSRCPSNSLSCPLHPKMRRRLVNGMCSGICLFQWLCIYCRYHNTEFLSYKMLLPTNVADTCSCQISWLDASLSLSRELRQAWLWCSTVRTTRQRRRGCCPWWRLLPWATTSHCVARTSPSAVPTPPLSHTLSRYSEAMLFTGDLASFNYFVDAVCGCFCFFPPGEGSGFRDCRSDHPVPTPEQLPGC